MMIRLRRACDIALVFIVATAAVQAGTIDRDYQFGDDVAESGTPGAPVGVSIDSFLLTFDSDGDLGAGDLNDLNVEGNPTYMNASSRPLASGSEVGIRFNGSGDYLVGDNLNNPALSRASIGYIDDNANPAPGPHNYLEIVDRGFQFWVRANNGGLGDGQTQSLVVDSNEHGALISDNDTWLLRYGGADYDSGVTVNSAWHHVMVARPFGPSGASGGARMWVDGIAVAAATGDYDGTSRERLVVGANTSLSENGVFDGGTDDWFTGDMDNLQMFIIGDNSSNTGPPPGKDYGGFEFGAENEFAASQLTGVPGDIDQDNDLDDADKAAFVSGWLAGNVVNGIRVGDLNTVRDGDLNFDGITNLGDLIVMQDALTTAGMAPISAAELTTVPEPSSLLLCLGGLALLWRRQRAKR